MHLFLYFRARAIRRCHLNFSPDDPCCHGNELFWAKNDHNLALLKNNCALFALTSYFRARAMQWCRVSFSHEDPCCHGNQPFLFNDKIDCGLTRASNAETQLLGYIAWQWDRYLVPQNIFLVITCFAINQSQFECGHLFESKRFCIFSEPQCFSMHLHIANQTAFFC